MIMKANKQIGFIYKNNESIDKILKDGEVVFERGFLREKTSTTLPITFGGVGKDLKDYKVYGNTFQNTTSGKNLFDSHNYNSLDAYINTSGKILSAQNNKTIFIQCKPDTTYTIQKLLQNPTSNNRFRIGNSATLPSLNSTLSNLQRLADGSTQTYYTYKTSSDAQYLAIFLYYDTNIDTFDDMLDSIQIEEGSSATDYEPYTGGQPSPNPDYPQEIVSCGDRTKNLFNILTLINGYVATDGSFNSNHSKEEMRSDYIKVKPNTTYTFKIIYSSWAGFVYDNWIGIGEYSNDKSFIKRDTMTTGTQNYFTFTTSNTTNYVVLSARGLESATKVQFEQNSEFTSYEPYGYKIPINVRSENLLDVVPTSSNGITSVKNNNGSLSYSGTATSTWANITNRFYNDLEIGTYTLSISKVLDYRVSIRMYYEDGTYVNKVILPGQSYITFTIDQKVKSFYLYISNTLTTGEEYSETLYIQLTSKNTISAFQPYYNETTNIYLGEPLRKIDGYSDYIDFINGKVIRNIDEVVLDGSESWGDSKITRDVLTHRFKTLGTKSHVVDVGVSNKFIVKNSEMDIYDDVEMVQLSSATSNTYIGVKIYISRLLTNDVSGLINWLSSNPVTLDYVLSTPTEEDIELPNIPTIDGNNTLNIETEITPSQVYIKYKSNE